MKGSTLKHWYVALLGLAGVISIPASPGALLSGNLITALPEESKPSVKASGAQDLPFLETDAPPLTITRSGGQINVEWPLSASGWVLEQSPHLNSPIPWKPVPSNLIHNSLTNSSIAISASTENMYYRLRKLMPSVLVPGLTGAWTLDEGEGKSAQDVSGAANLATLSNVTWVPGRIGPGALWFNGGLADV